MRAPVYLLIIVCLLCLLWSCDDDEDIIGCRLYNHIFEDYIGVGTEHDTVYVFFVANDYQEYGAPLTFGFLQSTSYVDSIGFQLSVYGVSPTREPEPFSDIEWRSDTLYVWYSGSPPNLEIIDILGQRVSATPPCPMPYYRIDHVIIRHPEDIVVYPHEDMLP